MHRFVIAIALLIFTSAFSQHGSHGQLDLARQSEIIRVLKQKHKRWEETSNEHIQVSPFWNGIAMVQVQHGLNKDPVPEPYVYYATKDNRIYMDLTGALRSMKYVPATEDEAVNIAAMLVHSANPRALVIKQKEDIKSMPKKLARAHKVKPAKVASTDSTYYDVIMYSYHTAQGDSFTRRNQIEQLKRHTISLHKGQVRFDSEELHKPEK